MIKSQKPKLAKVPSKSEEEVIKEIQRLTTRGFKAAIILAKLGDETALAGLCASALIVLEKSKNLLRAMDAAANETIG